MPDEDIIIRAVTEDNEDWVYTVTFDSQGGSVVDSIKLYPNTKMGILPHALKAGYDLVGWYTESEGKGEKLDEATLISRDMTVYAYWVKNSQGNQDNTQITSVVINEVGKNIFVGDSFYLSVSIFPENVEDKTILWSSSDNKVANISTVGMVTALKAGTVEITAKTLDGAIGDSVTINILKKEGTGGSGNGSSSSGSSGGGGGSSSGGGSAKKPTITNILALPAYVVKGTWIITADGNWTFTDSTGLAYKNKWAAVYNPYANPALGQENFDWFYFDANGIMTTGWILDNGLWYYLSPVSDGTKGKMVTGWAQIDGYWYYLNPVSDGTRGAMYANRTTPDGYVVDANGRRVQ